MTSFFQTALFILMLSLASSSSFAAVSIAIPDRLVRVYCRFDSAWGTTTDFIVPAATLNDLNWAANNHQPIHLIKAKRVQVESHTLDFTDQAYFNIWPSSSAAMKVYAFTVRHSCETHDRTISEDAIVDFKCPSGGQVRELFPNWPAKVGTWNDCGRVNLPPRSYWAKPPTDL